MQLHAHGKGDEPGADWFNLLEAWWRRHGYYPEQAAHLDQEGDVTLHLTMMRSGKVQAVEVEHRSGSQWLDLAALAVFRGADLPPLPHDATDPDLDLDLTIHYVIIR